MHWRSVGAGLGLAAGLFGSVASAQDKDDKELLAYVLTMDKVQRLSAAAKELHALEKRHPEMGSENHRDLNDMVRTIQKYPDVVSVLSRNGFAPREYAVGFLTLVQSMMVVGMKKAGTFKELPPELAKMVSKANLAFTEQHYAEIRKLLPDWSSESDDQQ